MNSKGKEDFVRIIKDVIKKDGGMTIFRGWFANYARLGPHTVITMLTLETLRTMSNSSSDLKGSDNSCECEAARDEEHGRVEEDDERRDEGEENRVKRWNATAKQIKTNKR